MSTTTAFDFPAGRLDPLVELAGRLESMARALARWPGGGPAASTALRELARRARMPSRSAPPAGEAAPPGPPIVYLPALPWSFRFQRPQQLARALAAAGHPVLYCEAFARTRVPPQRGLQPAVPGVWRLRLAVAGRPDAYRQWPGPGSAAALARRIAAGLRQRPVMVLAQLPFWREVALRLRELMEAPLVYDRIDLHRGFRGVPDAVADREHELIAESDLVLASSEVLLAGAAPAARRMLVPNAVQLGDFPARAVPGATNGRVRVGYVGALGEWFDAGALRAAAEARPEWIFTLAGRPETTAVRALGELPNVELLGEIPYADVPAFLGGLRALVIPFLDLPLTRAVDPVKLYEGLAAGLPVVSVALPAVARWPEPLVYAYRGDGLPATLDRALAEDGLDVARRRREAVTGETWKARAAAVMAAVEALRPAGVS